MPLTCEQVEVLMNEKEDPTEEQARDICAHVNNCEPCTTKWVALEAKDEEILASAGLKRRLSLRDRN